MLIRRKPRPDRNRALSRSEVDQLLTRKDISLRERTLWRMLYETAARSAEVLALDIEDLDLPNRCAGAPQGRRHRHHRLTDRHRASAAAPAQGPKYGPGVRDRAEGPGVAPAADLGEHARARLSYQQAEALFAKASGGATPHQLRHSALTHDAEAGTGTPMLIRRSGHTSVRSLARYPQVSAEALMQHQAERDPARRR
jgi:integrase